MKLSGVRLVHLTIYEDAGKVAAFVLKICMGKVTGL